ncbi:MAG: RNA polymerase sigma factor [Deltaproteobacteria bacterium]|nr:RNA polymerase sigma factor [Deltaproteobacteria bacterium]
MSGARGVAPAKRGLAGEPGDPPADIGTLGDEMLVALALQGHDRATGLLYRRHAPFALNLAAHIAGSTQDIEDVVHDAYLQALDGLSTLRSPRAFRTWLGSIVVHLVRTRLRRGRLLRLLGLGRTDTPVDVQAIASDSASPQACAELAQIYALLQTVSVQDRIAWTLRYVEGHDLPAAAELAGCSLATVKRRIGRAQRHLERHFVTPSRGETRS